MTVKQRKLNKDPESPQKRARWRGSNFERRVAKLVQGVVVGRSKAVKVGDRFIQVNPQQPPDVINAWASFECKYMKELPKCMTAPLSQAIRNAPEGLTPVVTMGDRQGHRVVMMTEQDFLDWHER